MEPTPEPTLREKAAAVIDAAPNCALALIEPDGFPANSIITVAQRDGLNWVTFCTGLTARRTARIRHSDRASACFCDGANNVTLTGTIEILTDPETKKANWYAGLENHFSGYDDPNYCVLKLTTRRISLFVDWQEECGEL